MADELTSDWIVVGGGSAGCVVAARLTEDPNRRVLLFEAGPDWRSADAPEAVRSPNVYSLAGSGRYEWVNLVSQRTAAQEPLPYPQGKAVGGSSVINGMVASRALVEDYDEWARVAGPDWSYAAMLPALRRMEQDTDFGDRPHHGSKGPMTIERWPRELWSQLDCALEESAIRLGHDTADDENAPTGSGAAPIATTTRGRRRLTTNDAYLEPARDRPNLVVVGDATVDRVVLDGRRVRGVRVRVAGEWCVAHAPNVALCAGAFQTPAVLLRSGVGPDGPVVDLPVGEGLLDHPCASLWLSVAPDALAADARPAHNCRLRYSSGAAGAGVNDMMIVAPTRAVGLAEAFGAVPDGRLANLLIGLQQPISRGNVTVASDDPDAVPIVRQALLTDPLDRQRMRDGVRRAVDLLRQPEWRRVVENVAIDPNGTPLDAIEDPYALDRWLDLTVKHLAHASGTCRMGKPDDPRAVVDPHGRVLGLDGLWVADASTFPEIPRANTNLPTIAAAERVVELLD